MITLPYPPTVNNYYTIARGRKILSKRGRQYRKDCIAYMMEQKVQRQSVGPYAVTILAYPPDNRIRDLDNCIKAILDSLVHYQAIQDDHLIDDLRIQRLDRVKGGRVEISIHRIKGERVPATQKTAQA